MSKPTLIAAMALAGASAAKYLLEGTFDAKQIVAGIAVVAALSFLGMFGATSKIAEFLSYLIVLVIVFNDGYTIISKLGDV